MKRKKYKFYYFISFFTNNRLGGLLLQTKSKIDNEVEFKKLKQTVKRESNFEAVVILNIQYLGRVK